MDSLFVTQTEPLSVQSSFTAEAAAPEMCIRDSDKAVRNAFVFAIDKYLKSNSLYKKDEKKITFADVEESLILVINSFSTVTSYENQTKKSITNKFIQEAMTEFFRRQLEIYFIENKMDADKIAAQDVYKRQPLRLPQMQVRFRYCHLSAL